LSSSQPHHNNNTNPHISFLRPPSLSSPSTSHINTTPHHNTTSHTHTPARLPRWSRRLQRWRS
jgi:hypothetical protein